MAPATEDRPVTTEAIALDRDADGFAASGTAIETRRVAINSNNSNNSNNSRNSNISGRIRITISSSAADAATIAAIARRQKPHHAGPLDRSSSKARRQASSIRSATRAISAAHHTAIWPKRTIRSYRHSWFVRRDFAAAISSPSR